MAGLSYPIDRYARARGVRSDARVAAEGAAAGGAGAWLLASMLFAGGVIHLAMVPSHYGEWAPEGIAFAIAGWAQILLAAAAVFVPRRSVWIATAAISAGLIGAWAVSRTSGLPFGPEAGHAEAVTFIDLSCVAFEAAAIVLARTFFLRPALGAASGRIATAIAVGGSIAVFGVTSAALASPSARNHAAHSHGIADAHDHGDDRGFSLLTNGHHHEIVQQALDPATQTALDAQLRETRQLARKYPSVADAEAAGYRRAGPYSPGIGAHYIHYGGGEFNPDGIINGDDALHPLALIYDGTAPDSAIAGFMFYSMSESEPAGFAGPNDVWHYHENICLRAAANGQLDAPFGPDNAATDEQCTAAGGFMLKQTQWMAHVWSVPGYSGLADGTFAEANRGLACADGSYYQLPLEEWASHPLNTCLAQ